MIDVIIVEWKHQKDVLNVNLLKKMEKQWASNVQCAK